MSAVTPLRDDNTRLLRYFNTFAMVCKLSWLIFSLLILKNYSFIIQLILNELKKQSNFVFQWFTRDASPAQIQKQLQF